MKNEIIRTLTGTCGSIDHMFFATWDAAESNCKGLGGNLISVNSPSAQEELQKYLNDPDATGKFYLTLGPDYIVSRKMIKNRSNR